MCTATARAERTLPCDLTAPGIARRFLREAGCSEHVTSLLEPAVLLVSEMVTNAVRHGTAPLVVAVDCDEVSMQVRVHDGSPLPPRPRSPAVGDEGGRGLLLVDLMSHDWGVDTESDGKTVWFRLREND